MKNMLFAVITCFTLMLLLASTCSKSDAPAAGPDVLEINEGFLSTKTGIPIGSVGDTAYVRIYGPPTGPGGSFQVAGTIREASVESKDYYVIFERSSGGHTYIRCVKNGLYLGVRENGTTPGYFAWCTNWPTLDRQPDTRNEFIIKKKDDKHFTIESALLRGTYLNSTATSQISYSGPLRADELHFLEKQQEWFFLKPF